MSGQLAHEVFKREIPPGIPRDVLVVYCLHANEDGSEARPGLATVAEQVGRAERTVRRYVKRWTDAGVLTLTARPRYVSGRGTSTANVYAVDLSELPLKGLATHDGQSHQDDDGEGLAISDEGPAISGEGLATATHETADERPSERPSERPEISASAESADVAPEDEESNDIPRTADGTPTWLYAIVPRMGRCLDALVELGREAPWHEVQDVVAEHTPEGKRPLRSTTVQEALSELVRDGYAKEVREDVYIATRKGETALYLWLRYDIWSASSDTLEFDPATGEVLGPREDDELEEGNG